jgi:hypothetical protein
MLQRFQDRVGTAGLIVAIAALVLALGGGAYAASGALTSKQKKEVTKIAQTEAKKFAGKTGPAGSNGSNGSKGDTGATGPEGKQGPQGKQGPEGKQGEEGEPGEPGSPWTVGGTLPKGATETGTWSFSASKADGENAEGGLFVPISFPVPLASGLSETQVVFVHAPMEGGCLGSASNPTAPEGKLCVYKNELVNATADGVFNLSATNEGANAPGALLFLGSVTDGAYGFGSFAVTAG